MKKENECRLMIFHNVSNVCRRIQVFVLCLMGVLIFLELFEVRIDFGNRHSIKLAIFIIIAGLFIVSDTIVVYLQTLNDSLTIKRLAWNLTIVWASNVFVLCCTHNYIFGSTFMHILPTAVSSAFIIGGSQFMFYSLYMTFRRKQNKNNNDIQDKA